MTAGMEQGATMETHTMSTAIPDEKKLRRTICAENRECFILQSYSQQRTIQRNANTKIDSKRRKVCRSHSKSKYSGNWALYLSGRMSGSGEGGNLSCRLGKNLESLAKYILKWFDVNSMDFEFWCPEDRCPVKWKHVHQFAVESDLFWPINSYALEVLGMPLLHRPRNMTAFVSPFGHVFITAKSKHRGTYGLGKRIFFSQPRERDGETFQLFYCISCDLLLKIEITQTRQRW